MRYSHPLKVGIKKLIPEAVIPKYARPGDAGMDLVATSKTVDSAGNVVYGTGIAIGHKNNMINTVINGDCLDVMKSIPDGSIDAIITDPPYGMDFQSNYRKEKYAKIKNDNNILWIDNFINEIYRVMKDNTHGYIFCSFHNVDKFKQSIERKFKFKNILIWEKNNTSMGDLTGDYAPKYEMVLFFHKGRRKLLGGFRHANIFKFNRTGNNFHPTEKPVDLIEFLIKNSSLENETILDCFAGSGTTGVACQNTNRNYILIEKDEGYYEISKERLLKNKILLGSV